MTGSTQPREPQDLSARLVLAQQIDPHAWGTPTADSGPLLLRHIEGQRERALAAADRVLASPEWTEYLRAHVDRATRSEEPEWSVEDAAGELVIGVTSEDVARWVAGREPSTVLVQRRPAGPWIRVPITND